MKKEKALNKIDKSFSNGIAHRGFHDESINIVENSLPAFKRAIEHNIPFELDIHLSKDNELIVCHDSSLKRVFNKDGIIEELTLKELKDNYSFPDGTLIPTLKEVFELNNERVPIVIELKVYKGNYRTLAKKTNQFIKEFVIDKSKYMLISFDPRALYLVKKNKIVTELLICKERQDVYLTHFLFDGLDLEYSLINEKKYIKYSKKHLINLWTIESLDELKNIIDTNKYIDTVTFQFIDEKEVKEVLNNK